MTKEVTEVVYGFHLTEKEYSNYYKRSLKENDIYFLSDALLKVEKVTAVTTFPNAQHSIYVQIQTENSIGFSNIAQTCFSIIKNLIK